MSNKNKIVACIEARMTSSRLPGKVMMELYGKSVLQILIERLSRSKWIDETIIACTTNSEDDLIEELGKRLGIFVYRGSEEDVLGRVVKAVESVKGEVIVEITGDCPLMDAEVADAVIKKYSEEISEFDFVTNTGCTGNEKREIPLGMDVRVFSFNELKNISEITDDPEDREHVSLYYFRTGKDKYKLYNIPTPQEWKRDYNPRLCLDTKEDFEVIKIIYEALSVSNEFFNLGDILNYLDKNRGIPEINSKIIQKTVKDFDQI